MNRQCESPRRLALAARTPGLDAATFLRLVAACPDLELLENPDAAQLAHLGLTTSGIGWLTKPDQSRIDTDLRWLEQPGHGLLPCNASDYPELLRHDRDRHRHHEAPPLQVGLPAPVRHPELPVPAHPGL